MSKYEELDAMILESITTLPKSFADIYFGRNGINAKCQSFCPTPRDEPARVLDRRLQALRKKGLIVFMKGWRKAPGQ
ncbi:hypothetical protein AAH450_07855 [Erwinia sp. P7711]|uniref:hypothetical protein n=1 Tax=Erwinia sp. P7711 TaxID=3141451 RepID=UPI0031934A09